MEESSHKISSQQKNQLDKLTASELIHACSSPIAIISENGIIVDLNEEFQNLLPNLKIDTNLQEHISITDQKSRFAELLKSQRYTGQIKTANAFEHLVIIKFKRIGSPDNSYFLATARSEYGPYSNVFIQQVIDSIPDMIYIKDTNCKFILANNWTAKIIGADSPEKTIGKDYFDFYPKEIAQSYFEDDQLVIESGTPLLNKQEKVIVDGKTRWYSISKVPLFDNSGNTIGYIGIGRDVSQHIDEKQTLEKAWQEAEKADKLKSAFLANLSHEIRTPLNGILGFSQFLKQKDHTTEKRHKYLDIIHNNGKQLLMLLNDIIDVSMIESKQVAIKKQPFRMNNLLAHLQTQFEPQITENKLDITLKSIPGLPDNEDLLFSDDYRLHQVMSNLIGNALKFTKCGSIEFGYTLKDSMVTFFVSDTGIGISKAEVDEIFKRFRQADESVTRKYGGTGLGLSICKGLVEMLGGTIDVESKPGKGSKFFFTVPHQTSEK